MSQPHDTIRPRSRRRPPHGGGIPGETTSAPAEQSTRVLIRVPEVNSGAKMPAPRASDSAATAQRSLAVVPASSYPTPGNSSNMIALGSASAVPPPVTTASKLQGSTASTSKLPRQAEGSGAGQQLVKPASPAEKSQPQTKSHVRIHTSHADSRPHSAAPAMLDQPSNWVAGVLQRRSLLAFALILAAAIGVALMFENHSRRADRSTGDPYSNAAHNQWKSEAPYPSEAENTPDRATGQKESPYRYSAATSTSSGNNGDESTAANSIPDASMTNWLVTPSSHPATQDPQLGNPAAAAQRWNAPADANSPTGGNAPSDRNSPGGANMPARIQTPSSASPNTALNSSGDDQSSVYAVRRESQPSTGGGYLPGSSGPIPGLAAFDGNINNPAQISR